MKLLKRERAAQPLPPVTNEEIEDALRAVRLAEARLNNAEGEFVEVAVLELTAAEKRFNCLLRMVRAGATKVQKEEESRWQKQLQGAGWRTRRLRGGAR